MKQLLNGVAIAAVLAFASPALAQNLTAPPPPSAPMPPPAAAPMAPMAPPSAPMSPSAAAPDTGAAPMAAAPTRHRVAHHHHHVDHVAKKSGDPEGDQITQQLNQQVLDRTGAGGGAPPPMSGPGAPPRPMPMQGPGAPPPPGPR